MKKTILLVVAIGIVVSLSIFTIFGQRGLIHLQKLESQLHKIENDNTELALESNKIRTEIELLKKNIQYIEDIARKELGLIKPDELVYHLEETHDAVPRNN